MSTSAKRFNIGAASKFTVCLTLAQADALCDGARFATETQEATRAAFYGNARKASLAREAILRVDAALVEAFGESR